MNASGGTAGDQTNASDPLISIMWCCGCAAASLLLLAALRIVARPLWVAASATLKTTALAEACVACLLLKDRALDALSASASYFAVPLLRLLHIPKTMYFVMDGNRRWARQRGQPTSRGHSGGYDTLQNLLEILTELGVEEVTVYAFSIPNFKRSSEEKSFLMDLAEAKFDEMMQRDDVVQRHNVRVRVVGDRSRLPQSVLEAAERIERHTEGNTRCTMNIAFAYAARTEMLAYANSRGATPMWVGTPKGMPALWIRTSGERRFSDFLQWQAGFAHLNFQNVLWPDFRAWHLFSAILEYNWYYAATCKAMQESVEEAS